jgi:hypothetical protein
MMFLAATLSYYKAYRVNNYILHSIEKFEGYNDYSKNEIANKLKSIGYERSNIKCPPNRFEKNSYNVEGKLQNSSDDGYCIYLYWDENPKSQKTGKNVYYSYGVVTYLKMQIPLIGGLVKLPVYSRTYNMYHFPNS